MFAALECRRWQISVSNAATAPRTSETLVKWFQTSLFLRVACPAGRVPQDRSRGHCTPSVLLIVASSQLSVARAFTVRPAPDRDALCHRRYPAQQGTYSPSCSKYFSFGLDSAFALMFNFRHLSTGRDAEPPRPRQEFAGLSLPAVSDLYRVWSQKSHHDG